MSALTLNYGLWSSHVPTVRHNLHVLFVCDYNYSSYIVNNNRILFFFGPLGANAQTNGVWINKHCWLLYLFMRCISLGKFLRKKKSLILNPTILDWLFISFKLDLIHTFLAGKWISRGHAFVCLDLISFPFAFHFRFLQTRTQVKEQEVSIWHRTCICHPACIWIFYKPCFYLHMKGCSITTPMLGFPSTSDSLIPFVSCNPPAQLLCFISGSLAAALSGDQLGRAE